MGINDKDIPEGLAFSLAMNHIAMQNFANMSDQDRDDVIAESKNVKSKAEMKKIVNRLAEDKLS